MPRRPHRAPSEPGRPAAALHSPALIGYRPLVETTGGGITMPLTVEDRMDIQDLLARYNHAIDGGDAETWAATFTPDGTFTSGSNAFQGREQLTAFAKSFAERMAGTRHWVNNVVIDGEGDRATLRCYLHLLRVGDGAAQTVSTARYQDELRRVDGAWRFAARTVIRD
jgi:uncharacterized protein (TIGR02246 family)